MREDMYVCPHEDCLESDSSSWFEAERDMQIHHKMAHGKSLVKEETECVNCGDSFEYYPSDKEGKYCKSCVQDEDVHWGADRNRTIVSCENCGKNKEMMPYKAKRYENHFCDHDCLSKWRRGENHHQYLEDRDYGQLWYEMRRKCRERDDYTCQNCGKTKEEIGRNPDVHHIIKVRRFDDSEDAHFLGNLVCLCRSCHRDVEEGNVVLGDF